MSSTSSKVQGVVKLTHVIATSSKRRRSGITIRPPLETQMRVAIDRLSRSSESSLRYVKPIFSLYALYEYSTFALYSGAIFIHFRILRTTSEIRKFEEHFFHFRESHNTVSKRLVCEKRNISSPGRTNECTLELQENFA